MNSHFSIGLFQKNTCNRERGAIAIRRLRALLLCLGLCAIVAGLPAQAQSAPAAPTNYAVAVSTGVATWTKSSGASNYDLELRPGDATDLDDHGDAVTLRPGDVATVDFRTAPNARNCCLNGESYHSRIRAVGSNGNSAWTSWSAFTFSGTSSIPAAPTNYAVAASTGVATWTKSSSASNYDLELRPGDASDLDDHGDAVALLPGDVATVGFRTAPNARNCCLNGKSYHSRIRAVGSNGFSPWTSWSAFTFSGTSSIPNTPTGLSVASETGIASWSAPTGATGYDLELQVGTDGTTTTLMTGNFVEEDLTSATNCCVDQESYRTRIRATGANGFSPWSTWTTFVFGGTSSIADSPPGQRDTGDRDSGGSSGSRRQSEAKPTPKPGVDHLPYPTQDHSRLPVGAVVKSDSPWIQFREIKVAYLGYQSVIDAGARAAIDVWSPLRLEAEVCLEGTGSLLFLDASTSPRAQTTLESYARAGKTCAQIDRAGTVVLMPGQPTYEIAPTATATATAIATSDPYLIADSLDSMRPLANCRIGSNELLNLRERPAGQILGWYRGDYTAALARTTNWFQIDYNGLVGWVSAGYVVATGNCG